MGDGIRRIARAFYERAGKEEKEEAKEFFKKLDLNKDGKITLSEFKKGAESALSNNKVFKELESNRNGGLDFDDVLVLFYYSVKHAITIVRCRGCRQLIFGPSFSCFQCLFNFADRRYALCCDCYEKGEFKHQHPLSTSTSTAGDLLHERALLVKLSEMISDHPRSLTKKEMKKMWEDAKSENGAAASPEVEATADNLFKSMGGNHGGLDLKHFSKLMIQQESALDAFLKPSQHSDFATNFIKSEMKRVLTQSNSPPTTPTAILTHNNAATTSTLQTHFVNPSNHRLKGESSSKAIVPLISPLKVATTTFKILDMALTIASLSSMCTIM